MNKPSMLVITAGLLAFGVVSCTTTITPIVGLGVDVHEIDFSSTQPPGLRTRVIDVRRSNLSAWTAVA